MSTPLAGINWGGMPSTSDNASRHNDVSPTMQDSLHTSNLDKIPCIPLKNTTPKKSGRNAMMNKLKLKITFLVGKNKDIKPREKFATLLFLLIHCFPSIILEEWGSTANDYAQSITSGTDLSYE
eukprot:914744-Ditylum_brightwellii.AAC.1